MGQKRRQAARKEKIKMKTALDSVSEAKKSVKRNAKIRGVYEKDRGSGVWWIRFVDAQGRYRREKAGTRATARNLYTKRKNDALEGRKLPEKLRSAPASFAEIANDAVGYIERRYSRPADEIARIQVLKTWFSGCSAYAVTTHEVEAALATAISENHWSASSANHH
jgi:hypothetical protein